MDLNLYDMVYNMVHNMVHDLRKNTAGVQVFFGGARVHQMSTQAHEISCTKIPNSSSPEIDIKNCFIPLMSCLNSDQIV